MNTQYPKGLRAEVKAEVDAFAEANGVKTWRIIERARINTAFFDKDRMSGPCQTDTVAKIYAAMMFFEPDWIFRFQRVEELVNATQIWCQAHGTPSLAIAAELRDLAAWRLHRWPDQCREPVAGDGAGHLRLVSTTTQPKGS